MTFQQIKDSLPKYRYLTPGVDVWREGDEKYWDEMGWSEPSRNTMQGCKVQDLGRRPIPDEVLDNQAFWVLYNKLATVAPAEPGVEPYINSYGLAFNSWGNCHGLRKFGSIRGESDHARECVKLLGGEQNIIKHLSAGDLYSKWLGEQLT